MRTPLVKALRSAGLEVEVVKNTLFVHYHQHHRLILNIENEGIRAHLVPLNGFSYFINSTCAARVVNRLNHFKLLPKHFKPQLNMPAIRLNSRLVHSLPFGLSNPHALQQA